MSKTQPILDLVPESLFAIGDLADFLIFPYDPDRRKQSKAVAAARLMAAFDAPKDLLQKAHVKKAYFGPSGLKTVVEAPSDTQLSEESEKAFAGPAAAAGRLLIIIATLDRFHAPLTASQNRAAAVLRASARSQGVPIPPEREFSGLWKAHGAIAPLWAAAHTAGFAATMEESEVNALMSSGSVRRILSWAAWYREFALNHTPPSAQGPMLTEQRAIVLPSGIVPAEPPLSPLSPELLAVAKSYRAPTPEQ